jgi:hypothetical protein
MAIDVCKKALNRVSRQCILAEAALYGVCRWHRGAGVDVGWLGAMTSPLAWLFVKCGTLQLRL